MQIHADVAAAARYGLKPGDIRRATAVLVAGIPVGSYYQQQQIFDVTVWSEPSVRRNVTAIRDLLLDTPSGGQVPLDKVATVSVQPAPTMIAHDQVSRYTDVTAGFRGGDVGAALKSIDAKVQALTLPLGYHVEVSSVLQQQRGVDLRVWLYVLAVAAGVFLLLQAAFRSWGRAALLFFTLPLAGAGGALAALLAGRLLTVGALIGFVVVFGVAVRQGILLVSRVRELEQADGVANGADLVVRACREAAFPVAVTAVGLALVMLPFVVRGDIAGMEILRPLALVVLGGLVTWVFYTLFVLPGLYLSLVLRGRRRPAVVPDREAS